MNFNSYYRELLQSLNESDSFQPKNENNRQAYAVFVTLDPDNIDSCVNNLDEVYFEFNDEGNDTEGFSQWWDANNQVLYSGDSYQQALNVFKTSLSTMLENFGENNILAKATEQIAKAAHTQGEFVTWRVIKMDEDVADFPSIAIGLEINGLAYNKKQELDKLSQTINDPGLSDLF